MRSKRAKIVFIILLELLVSQFNCTTEKSSAEYQPLIDAYLSFWNTGNFDGIDQVFLLILNYG